MHLRLKRSIGLGTVLAGFMALQSAQAESDGGDQTALEILTGKRIVVERNVPTSKPHYVYRPKAPLFHQDHPENKPEEPKIMKHPLADHPEVNNNRGLSPVPFHHDSSQ
ncbi:hypothetical protein NF212_12165 [Parasalinivibrio latis]|uniref:hypothetical protein n=1 Tax=Parasalinivibrio latis TaxID=2952610 RepID=UPI0030E32D11